MNWYQLSPFLVSLGDEETEIAKGALSRAAGAFVSEVDAADVHRTVIGREAGLDPTLTCELDAPAASTGGEPRSDAQPGGHELNE
jgi:hypothetical protein